MKRNLCIKVQEKNGKQKKQRNMFECLHLASLLFAEVRCWEPAKRPTPTKDKTLKEKLKNKMWEGEKKQRQFFEKIAKHEK